MLDFTHEKKIDSEILCFWSRSYIIIYMYLCLLTDILM